MSAQKLLLKERSGLATVTLNRPESDNAVDSEMIEAIQTALSQFSHKGRSRVLLLRGKGEHFCARLDLGRTKPLGAGEWHDRFSQVARVNHLLTSFPGVSVALVQGKAFGFGFALAAQADLTIAADNARFAFPVIRAGQPPTLPASYLSRLIPRKKAFELLISGMDVDAYQAERLGVVNHVVASEKLESEGKLWVARLLALDANALFACKNFFRTTVQLTTEDTARYGVSFLANFMAAKRSRSGKS